MIIQNVREVLEAHHQNKIQIKYVVAQKLFCMESQRNVAETILHPIQGTKKLCAVIPLSNGLIAVRGTSCICRQC